MKIRIHAGLPVLLYLADTALFLLLPLAVIPPFDLAYTVSGDLLRVAIVAFGAASFAVLTILYARIYLKNRNQSRLFVVLSIIFFEVAFITEIINSSITVTDGTMRRFQIDSGVLPLSLALFFFLSAGHSLMGKGKETGKQWFTIALFSMVVGSLCLHLIDMVVRIGFRNDSVPAVRYVMLFLMYVAIVIIIVTFMVFAGKMFKLVKKADSPAMRQGLRAIGMSFLLFSLFVLLLFLGDQLDDAGDVMKLAAIATGVIAFYFIYSGFIRPSQAIKDGNA